ncbi:MAG: Gene Transfer Agent FAD/FMN-containing dehydrogenase [uncultured Sphingomonas sp.]|uniref:Gene Transfer Agent FAD/FMN-containing dehydrogenase n=1 Tax=uncultured Sphingomonas sp. TaxID=158754 RepID=A0A6J4SGF7_9SPHN|nr:DUF2163 domain-containing protein [uncultured Sphingomonas sp.]CAA9498213.1 MAG: Gene Transfer Agent FAD/FMN-containing dehydrogenase [uncultured Sphingomonas sp.]
MTGSFDGPLTTISFCWLLERRDGAGVALTTHDSDLRLADQYFEAAPGLRPAAIVRGSGGEPTGEVSGALSSDALQAEDLWAGRWDGALSRMMAVDWHRPEQEPVNLAAGEIGDIVVEGTGFQADLLGPEDRLKATVCPTTSPECRAVLGDKQCRVNMAGRSLRGEVVSASANRLTLDRVVPDSFAKGALRWLSGDNCGLRSVISSCPDGSLLLREVPRRPVRTGERVILYEGCDKRLETCRTRFANVLNFRGEPHLPGNDLLTRYPGA